MSKVPTVIIPCLNEENYVGRVLGDLAQQTVQPAAVYVVDCHSTDKTVDEAKKFSKKLPLKVYQSTYRSAAAARNTGAERATTDYVLFLDADMRVPKDFIARLTARADKTQAEFVSPHFKAEGHHPLDAFFAWCMDMWIRLNMLLKRRAMGIGGGMYVKRAVHEAAGGYDPKKREFDDIDYCARLNRRGVTYAYARKAVAITSSRRLKEQGRWISLMQAMPDNWYVAQHLVRPMMKRLGVGGKWDEL